jgi:hypothetical protein
MSEVAARHLAVSYLCGVQTIASHPARAARTLRDYLTLRWR